MSQVIRVNKPNNPNTLNESNFCIQLGNKVEGKMLTPNEQLIVTPIEDFIGEIKPNRILFLEGEGNLENRFVQLGSQNIDDLNVIGVVYSRIFRED